MVIHNYIPSDGRYNNFNFSDYKPTVWLGEIADEIFRIKCYFDPVDTGKEITFIIIAGEALQYPALNQFAWDSQFRANLKASMLLSGYPEAWPYSVHTAAEYAQFAVKLFKLNHLDTFD